jgi:molybdopterin converting factor small subunit
MTQTYISIKLFATLSKYTPASADQYPVLPGTTIRNLLNELGVPENDVKLIFINGIKKDLPSTLNGGERVGIFPPVGGG